MKLFFPPGMISHQNKIIRLKDHIRQNIELFTEKTRFRRMYTERGYFLPRDQVAELELVDRLSVCSLLMSVLLDCYIIVYIKIQTQTKFSLP